MASKLETFIDERSKEFDSIEPSPDMWANVASRMENKSFVKVNSKLLTKSIFFGLSTVAILVTIYFISHKSDNNNVPSTKKNSDKIVSAEQEIITDQIGKEADNEPLKQSSIGDRDKSLNIIEENQKSDFINSKPNQSVFTAGNDSSTISKVDSSMQSLKPYGSFLENKSSNSNSEEIKSPTELEKEIYNSETKETENNKTKRGFNLFKSRKKSKESEDHLETYNYVGTIWKGPAYCTALHTFQFPGQYSFSGTVKTIGCNDLPKDENLKAVWIKGKTDKEIIFSVSNGFKNIKLIKPNGTTINPIAISHNKTQGHLISYYSGSFFNITFTKDVEIILFFQSAEKGDKVLLGNSIEAILK